MIHKRYISLVILIVILAIAIAPMIVFKIGKSKIYTSIDDVEQTPVAIVFGAGLNRNGTPSAALMDRLTVAYQLYENKSVEHILVSGDNSLETYNEPDAMRDALIELGVNEESIFTDYAGRRTYDTCVRAKEIWKVDNAILISQGYHLPRAIWTCNSLGVESSGISASLQLYAKQDEFETREILAIYKMMFDLYISSPDYISGEVMTDIDK